MSRARNRPSYRVLPPSAGRLADAPPSTSTSSPITLTSLASVAAITMGWYAGLRGSSRTAVCFQESSSPAAFSLRYRLTV